MSDIDSGVWAKDFFIGAAVTLFVAPSVSVSAPDSELTKERGDSGAKPNIVILYADDMGWGDTGAYGHPYIKTPSLDRLANEGQRWTDFICACSRVLAQPCRAAHWTTTRPFRALRRGQSRVIPGRQIRHT